MDLKSVTFYLLVAVQLHLGRLEDGSKIVGGQIIDITSIPYFVSLQYKDNHICGGSILNEKWIISAGHCAASKTPEHFSIRSGSSRKTRGGQIHKVQKVIIHPNYSDQTLDNDFMLLELKDPIIFDEKRQPIQLGLPHMYYEGAKVLTSGFGSTKNKYESSEFLRGVVVDIANDLKCSAAYKNIITKNMFCAAAKNKDSCQGDSGGPIESVYYGTLLGIVSFGMACADDEFPGVYSKVSEAKEWIESVTKIAAK